MALKQESQTVLPVVSPLESAVSRLRFHLKWKTSHDWPYPNPSSLWFLWVKRNAHLAWKVQPQVLEHWVPSLLDTRSSNNQILGSMTLPKLPSEGPRKRGKIPFSPGSPKETQPACLNQSVPLGQPQPCAVSIKCRESLPGPLPTPSQQSAPHQSPHHLEALPPTGWKE